MGDIDSGINLDHVKWFGTCFACAELLGRAGSPSPDYCSMVRSEGEAAVWLADVLRDEHPQLLLDLLGVNIEA